MKRQNIPMSFAEYEVMEHPFGWKVEYWDGQARLTPREVGVTTRIDLSPETFSPPPSLQQHTLVSADITYTHQMIARYFEVFANSVEFCNWPLKDIQKSAERDINRYFSGERGAPLPHASVIALAPNSQTLIGLALFVLKKKQIPFLELLYVHKPFQRQGIATAMVLRGACQLMKAGFKELTSRYHICNTESRQWHHQFGFQDIYDPYYIRLKLGWLNNEIWRREKLGISTDLEHLKQKQEHWKSLLEASDGY